MVTDVVATGLLITAATAEKDLDYVAVIGGATYLLGAPISHLAHGEYGHAGVSLGLRLAPLLVAAMVAGAAIREVNGSEGDNGTCRGSCVLFSGAVFVAPPIIAVLDDVLLARYPAPSHEQKPAPLSWSPLVTPRREGGFSLGVVGLF